MSTLWPKKLYDKSEENTLKLEPRKNSGEKTRPIIQDNPKNPKRTKGKRQRSKVTFKGQMSRLHVVVEGNNHYVINFKKFGALEQTIIVSDNFSVFLPHA